jgi:hypothetical protein
MKEGKLTYVRDVKSGDWEGWYLDGELLKDGHSIDADDLLAYLDIEYESVSAVLEQGGRLPKKLDEVVTEAEYERREKLAKAAALRQEADALEAQAQDMVAG